MKLLNFHIFLMITLLLLQSNNIRMVKTVDKKCDMSRFAECFGSKDDSKEKCSNNGKCLETLVKEYNL